MSKYGIHSRRMLTFLFENPGSTAREVSEHLCNNQIVEQIYVRYRNVWHYRANSGMPARTSLGSICESWLPKKYVLHTMIDSKYYGNVEILEERAVPLSKICRGKFAYLTSPYCSRTLAADSLGTKTHPRSANRNSQRRWFWRKKHQGRYIYFLTSVGMAALKEHGSM
jgi:hypothetical protein